VQVANCYTIVSENLYLYFLLSLNTAVAEKFDTKLVFLMSLIFYFFYFPIFDR